MEAFVSSVYLWDDGRIVINYNYTGENNQLTLRQIEQELVDMDGAEGSPLDSSAPLKLANPNTVMCSDFVHLELLGKSKIKVCIRLK